MYRYCVVAFIFVATQYLMSKRIRGTGLFRRAVHIHMILIKER